MKSIKYLALGIVFGITLFAHPVLADGPAFDPPPCAQDNYYTDPRLNKPPTCGIIEKVISISLSSPESPNATTWFKNKYVLLEKQGHLVGDGEDSYALVDANSSEFGQFRDYLAVDKKFFDEHLAATKKVASNYTGMRTYITIPDSKEFAEHSYTFIMSRDDTDVASRIAQEDGWNSWAIEHYPPTSLSHDPTYATVPLVDPFYPTNMPGCNTEYPYTCHEEVVYVPGGLYKEYFITLMKDRVNFTKDSQTVSYHGAALAGFEKSVADTRVDDGRSAEPVVRDTPSEQGSDSVTVEPIETPPTAAPPLWKRFWNFVLSLFN